MGVRGLSVDLCLVSCKRASAFSFLFAVSSVIFNSSPGYSFVSAFVIPGFSKLVKSPSASECPSALGSGSKLHSQGTQCIRVRSVAI